MLQKNLLLAILMLSTKISTAQIASVNSPVADTVSSAAPEVPKKEPALSISGSVDAYYKYDFANTNANGFTSFTQTHNSFSLGMASVKFEHKGNKIGAVADLGFGQRASDFSYNDNGITQAIKQLYVSYSPAEWVKFTLGTWATHVGYELLDPQLNRNYSMSYMFTNGPFSHTGLKAEITKGKHGFMVGVANPTDYRVLPTGQINKKFVIAQYSLAASDKVNIFVNYVGGQSPDSSKSQQFDAVVTAKISNKFSLAFNGTIADVKAWDGVKNSSDKTWWGSALYINYDFKDWFGITLREELFNDKNQLKTYGASTGGGQIFASTLSANFKKGGFIFIPEFRLDHADKKILFTDKNGAFKTDAASFIFSAIYSF